MRYQLFDMIENDDISLAEKVYDGLMLVTIFLSLIPLMVKEEFLWVHWLDWITATIFCIDYLLRWATADYKLGKGRLSFVLYPLTGLAIVDLLSILPTFLLLNPSFKLFRVVRLGRVLRVFRLVRHSRTIAILKQVIQKQRSALVLVGILTMGYIFLTALLIFNVEPGTFSSFFDALYWATISLTTIGYGDIYAQSLVGKCITMLSSLLGIAVVALPSGIITAGYMDVIMSDANANEGKPLDVIGSKGLPLEDDM